MCQNYLNKQILIYGKAISDLFKTNDPIEILRSKEIYEYLQRAINRCVDLTEFA